jgi:hypothetical protein
VSGGTVLRTMSEERERRAGRNQALFREVNERIAGLNVLEPPLDEQWEFICECADPACVAMIAMTGAEYREVRSQPTYFFVAPGHVTADVETVVADVGRYVIVDKHGKAADVAVGADPRA